MSNTKKSQDVQQDTQQDTQEELSAWDLVAQNGDGDDDTHGNTDTAITATSEASSEQSREDLDEHIDSELREDLNAGLQDPLLSLRRYPTLALQNLTVIDHATKLTALDRVNINFYSRKSHSILVSNDEQRRALLSVIAALTTPHEGSVIFKSQPLTELMKHDWRGHFLGLMTQQFTLLSNKSARENLMYVMRASGRNFLKALHLVADDVLREVGFDLKRNAIAVKDLHAGERQLVSLAKALCCEPAVLVADEPTLQLTQDDRKHVLNQLWSVAGHRDCAVIVITRDPDISQQAEIQYRLD